PRLWLVASPPCQKVGNFFRPCPSRRTSRAAPGPSRLPTRELRRPTGGLGSFPRCRSRQAHPAGRLRGGGRRMARMGVGVVARRRLLMLDEPSLGLAPVVVRAIFEDLRRINHGGLTILLVEQNVLRSLQLCHRGYVLENGRISLAGRREDLLASPHIKQAYLGI